MILTPVLLKGLISFFPGTSNLFSRKSGGTDSARYCYSIWLRHLCLAFKNGLIKGPPPVIAEIGPGDSLGIGIAGLISGSEAYHAFDVVRFANEARNLSIFEEMIDLFQRREDIPGEKEFPKIGPKLNSYRFPAEILPHDHLRKALAPPRLLAIREAIKKMGSMEDQSKWISYIVPWDISSVIDESSIDMVYSQAVMEHVEDIQSCYQAMYQWLKPGGFISHQIDFKCHNTATKWNGHWAYSRWLWKFIKGKRRFFLNRAPYSVHINSIKNAEFEIVSDICTEDKQGIDRARLAPEFRYFSDHDLTTRNAFIQAKKQQIHRKNDDGI